MPNTSTPRLVILGMNYAPELTGIAPYTTGLAEHLVTQGWRVTVATTFPHYPQWSVQAPYKQRLLAKERVNGVEVRRSAVLLPRPGSAVSRIAYDSSLALGTLLSTMSDAPADIVLCVSPPIQLALTGALLARRWRVPHVLLVKDLPIDAALAVGMIGRGLAFRFARRLERLAYRLVDSIIVISRGFRQSILRQGADARRITVIPDWANTDTIRPKPADPAIREWLGAEASDPLVLHTGNMGEKQGLASAIVATNVENQPGFQLTLIGDGSDRGQLEAIVQSKQLSRVRLLPLQPAELLPSLLAAADVLLVNQRAKVIDSVAPSKLLTYMAAGRPIVAAVHPGSEAARVISDANCGVLVCPQDPVALSAAIASLYRDPALRAALGENGRIFAETNFSRDHVLQRYEALLTQMLQ